MRGQAALARLPEDSRLNVIEYADRPFNYSWVNNYAISRTESDVICLLNDDAAVIHPEWLANMVGHLLQDGVGAVGPMLYYPDDTIQHGGVILGVGGVAGHYHHLLPRGEPGYFGRAWCDQDLSCVTAGCMLLRREAFADVGGFDEALRDRVQRRRPLHPSPRTRVADRLDTVGASSITSSRRRSDGTTRRRVLEQFKHEIALTVERWERTLLTDPNYSPNLSLAKMNDLAFPPRRAYPWRRASAT